MNRPSPGRRKKDYLNIFSPPSSYLAKEYVIKKSICFLFPRNYKKNSAAIFDRVLQEGAKTGVVGFSRRFLGQTLRVSAAPGLAGSRQDESNGGVIERQTTEDDSRPDGNAPPLTHPPTLP